MMRLSVDELLAHLRALQLTDDASDQVLGMSAATAKAYLCLYQSRATTLTELADSVRTPGTRPVMSQIPESASWLAPNTGRLIHQFIEEVETLSVWDKHALLDTGRRVVKSASVGLALLGQPLRFAIVGTTSSPGIFDIMAIMGRDESIARLRSFEELLRLSA